MVRTDFVHPQYVNCEVARPEVRSSGEARGADALAPGFVASGFGSVRVIDGAKGSDELKNVNLLFGGSLREPDILVESHGTRAQEVS